MCKIEIYMEIISWEETMILSHFKINEVIKMIGVYKITNIINDKSYIGISVDIERRWEDHKLKYNWLRESNKTLYQAFEAYSVHSR